VSRITRKELKSDKFALEVEHGLSFFEEHKNQTVKYGAIAIGVIILAGGFMFYERSQGVKRQEALGAAIRVQEAPTVPSSNGGFSFPSQEAKDQEAIKVFSDVSSKYSGSNEAEVAQYYLASVKADQGKLGEAEKIYQEVADKASDKNAALAKLALAQIYFADGRAEQAEKLLRDMIAHPTPYVSAEQATVTLVRGIMHKKPAEARKLLEPIRAHQDKAGQAAITLWNEIPAQ